MKKKQIVIICIVIIIILLAIVIGLRVFNQNEDLNEVNTQNTSVTYTNTNDAGVNESQVLEGAEESNTENNIVNDKEIVTEGSENMNNQNEEIKINLIVNHKTFTATLNHNQTVNELISMFPMTLHMSDLHANEKYNYLSSSLTTNSNIPERIHAGDIKLFGNNCLVVFYDSFSTSYSYTDLGKVDDVDGFVSELGRGDISITFEIAN